MSDLQENPVKKRSKREENREKSKELILRASLELFAMKGYGSTTMEMIADRAGISRGLPYLYFESKEKILYTILKRHFERERDSIRTLPKKHSSAEEFVSSIVAWMRAPFQGGSEADECLEMRLIMSMMLLPETKSIILDWVHKFKEEIMGEFFEELKESFESYGIDAKDVEMEMEYLRMNIFGYTFLRMCLGEEFPYQVIEQKVVDNYLGRLGFCPEMAKKNRLDSGKGEA
jgi:AcrR family transcriptional regulator